MQRFDDLQPGALLGTRRQRIDADVLDQWAAVYGPLDPASEAPLGLVTVLVMRAYCSVLDHRPPGNINVGQSLRILRPPRRDEDVEVAVSCRSKRRSQARLIVEFGVEMRAAASGQLLADGALVLFWAA